MDVRDLRPHGKWLWDSYTSSSSANIIEQRSDQLRLLSSTPMRPSKAWYHIADRQQVAWTSPSALLGLPRPLLAEL